MQNNFATRLKVTNIVLYGQIMRNKEIYKNRDYKEIVSNNLKETGEFWEIYISKESLENLTLGRHIKSRGKQQDTYFTSLCKWIMEHITKEGSKGTIKSKGKKLWGTMR